MAVNEEGRKPEYEKILAGELEKQAKDRLELEEVLKEAKEQMLAAAETKGREGLEIVELGKSIDEQHNEQRKAQAEVHQKRLDDLALLYLGPPSERDRDRER